MCIATTVKGGDISTAVSVAKKKKRKLFSKTKEDAWCSIILVFYRYFLEALRFYCEMVFRVVYGRRYAVP